MEIAQTIHKLADTFGVVGALGIFGWWYERRANRDLQKQLLRLATSQVQALSELKAALSYIKRMPPHD